MANDYSSESEEEVYRKKKTKSVKRHRKSRSLVKKKILIHCLLLDIFFFAILPGTSFFYVVYRIVDIVTFDTEYYSECI